MIKKFLNWKGGLIVGATTAILIAAIASPIVGKNAVTASYNKKLSLRTGAEAAKAVQSFNLTSQDFDAAVANLQLKDQYKNKLTASTALELHNDKSYSFELIDAVDLSTLKQKDPDMEFELRTISKTENSSNPSVATKDGVINNIYVIGIDTKNNIYFHATGSISGFLPDAQADASNNYFVDGARSNIKVKDEVQDKTATAVALELQKLFSQEIKSPTPKSADKTAPVAPAKPAETAKPADSTGSATTPAKPVENPKAPATTSAEGLRPKQADGQTAASTTSTTSGTPSKELAQAFKAALSQIGGFNLKDPNGDFTFLPDSYYIAPVVDANNKLKFSNVNNINETLSIDVEIIGPDGTKLPTTLDFANLGNTSQATQEKLIQSFDNSYKLKPGIAKALADAKLGIADVVYASSLPSALASQELFKNANVKDFAFWFEKIPGQKFGLSLDSGLRKFDVSIAQGDAAPSADEITALKASGSIKLSIAYSQKYNSATATAEGFTSTSATTFQAGTNLILDTRGEFVNELVANIDPRLASSEYTPIKFVGKTPKTEDTRTSSPTSATQQGTQQPTQQATTEQSTNAASQSSTTNKVEQSQAPLTFEISPVAPILFANHLDTAITAFNASSASNINLAVSQLSFLLDQSGNGATLSSKTYGQYIKDVLTSLSEQLPEGVTLALKGDFNEKTSEYKVWVKVMAGSKLLNKYSFTISNVSAPNYAYDAASRFGANVFVDATFDKLVGTSPRIKEGKDASKGNTKTLEAVLTSGLLNYNNFNESFANSQIQTSTISSGQQTTDTQDIKLNNNNVGIKASQQGIVLGSTNKLLTFHAPSAEFKLKSGGKPNEIEKDPKKIDTTLTNGTLLLAFKASELKTGFRTYFLESKEGASNGDGTVGLFIEKVPTITTAISTQSGVEKINKEGYVIGISYDNVKGSNNGTPATGDIVALFTSASSGVIEKDNHQVFQLLRSGNARSSATSGVEYNNSVFKNTFNGNLQYGDVISKTNNGDPTLLLEINIKNLPDKSQSTSIKNSINFTLYSSAIKDPLNNPIRSEFSQPVYVDDSSQKKATSFINRGIDFYGIGDKKLTNDQNHITFKAMAVFKDKDEHGITQNAEVRRQIAKAFIDQYFTEDQEPAKASQGAKQVKAAPAGAAIQS